MTLSLNMSDIGQDGRVSYPVVDPAKPRSAAQAQYLGSPLTPTAEPAALDPSLPCLLRLDRFLSFFKKDLI